MKNIWAIIPARGGSKGLPGKNVRLLGGKPLIAYSIEPALASDRVSRVIVSTDDPHIAEVARTHGAEVPFLRPAELSGDKSDLRNAIYYTVDRIAASEGPPDGIVILLPTHPFRASSLINRAVDRLTREYQVTTATPFEITPSRCRFLHEGRWHRLGGPSQPIQLYRPTGSLIGMAYLPPGSRFVDSPAKALDYLRARFGTEYGLHGGLLVLNGLGSDVDIDTSEDFSRAEAYLRGEGVTALRNPSMLSSCVVGLNLEGPPVITNGSAGEVPVTLEPDRRYLLHIRAYRQDRSWVDGCDFYEIMFRQGRVLSKPFLTAEREIRLAYTQGTLRVQVDLPEGAECVWLWIGDPAPADHYDIALPFSLPPLWKMDLQTDIRWNLLTGRPIYGRQDVPVIEEEPVPIMA